VQALKSSFGNYQFKSVKKGQENQGTTNGGRISAFTMSRQKFQSADSSNREEPVSSVFEPLVAFKEAFIEA
jgi:hypothetical protein